MRDFSLIKQNILQYLEIKGITKYKFYELTGVSNGVLSQKSGMSEENIMRILSAFSDLNPFWLITGKAPMLVNDLETTHILSEPPSEYGKIKGVPILDLVAGRNLVANENEATEFINPGDLFKDAQAVMRVYGDSMETKYPSGSFVPVKMLNDKSLIIYGQDYVIQTKEYRVLKRIQKSKLSKNILACSINQEVYQHGELAGKLFHEPFDVAIDDIISISIVLGCVTRNQITNIY
jgi:hypothetical protein